MSDLHGESSQGPSPTLQFQGRSVDFELSLEMEGVHTDGTHDTYCGQPLDFPMMRQGSHVVRAATNLIEHFSISLPKEVV